MKLSASEMNWFETAVQSAHDAAFSGWDFSYIAQYGGEAEEPKAWHYEKVVRDYLVGKESLLDMGTGGGEFLARLRPFPPQTYATEAYPPNIPVATERLAPLGVTVVAVAEDGEQEAFPLPFDSDFFGLIINRHEAYEAKEVARVLQAGGTFITQQVGQRNSENLRVIFGNLDDPFAWDLATCQAALAAAGLKVVVAQEHVGYGRIYDIRTLVYMLKTLPWEFPNFDVNQHKAQLLNIHIKILRDGFFDTVSHRFFVVAQKVD